MTNQSTYIGQPNHLETIKKKMNMGQQKSPGFSRIKDGGRNMKEIFYLQPNLFIEDTENFLNGVHDQIEVLN